MRNLKKASGWSVGKIARRSGVSIATLHFYDSKGLIFSWRNEGNQRRFDPSVLRRIAVIKSAQRLGVSLQAIAAAMSELPRNRAPSTSDWEKMSMRWRAELQQRITRLERLRDELDGCIGCGCLSLKTCQLRNPEDAAGETGSGAVFLKRDNNMLLEKQNTCD